LLGQYFAQREIAFDRVVTGDMRRHKETAAGIQRVVKVLYLLLLTQVGMNLILMQS
jgi:phosphohistidine phosphatase SixA